MRIAELLKSDVKHVGKIAAFLIVSLAVLSGLTIYLNIDRGGEQPSAWLMENVPLAVAVNVFSSVLFLLILGRRDRSLVAELGKVAEPTLLEEFLEDLKCYKSLYYEDFSIEVRLTPCHDNRGLVLCKMSHRYKKSAMGRRLAFCIYRIQDKKNYEHLPPISEACLTHEFVWYNFETDMAHLARSEYYKLENVSVGGQKIRPEVVRDATDGKEWCITLPSPPEKDAYLSFDVIFPLEIEDTLLLTSEFPAKGARITFNYAQLKNKIKVFSFQKAGIKKDPFLVDDEDEGVIRIESGHWLLPKDAQVFVWWARDEESEAVSPG